MWLAATAPDSLPAPRVEHPQYPFSAELFQAVASGQLDPARTPVLQPQGFGIIGRPWTPRRQLAGTYDQAWLDERHPNLPEDFDFAYWNTPYSQYYAI